MVEMSGESPKAYELEIRVSTHGQEPAVLHREYVTSEKMSTDGALGAIWESVSNDTKAHCRTVADGG
jgi:hypothetical protein